MNRLLNALLLCGIVALCVFELKGNNGFSRQGHLTEFEGEWVFEKAAYMERRSLAHDYQVKYEINTAEGLEAFAVCFHQSVKRIRIHDIVQVDCPFVSYCGRAILTTIKDPKGDKHLLTIGYDPEDSGKETLIPGLFFNITGLDYWIEKLDDETIAMTKEALCTDNSVETYGAIRCILKKVN